MKTVAVAVAVAVAAVVSRANVAEGLPPPSTVCGRVYDATTLAPMRGVQLVVFGENGTPDTTQTDSLGSYQIGWRPDWRVELSAKNHRSVTLVARDIGHHPSTWKCCDWQKDVWLRRVEDRRRGLQPSMAPPSSKARNPCER